MAETSIAKQEIEKFTKQETANFCVQNDGENFIRVFLLCLQCWMEKLSPYHFSPDFNCYVNS